MANKVVAVLDDLMFTVKIADAAKRAGVKVEFVKTGADALRTAEGAVAIILDLNFAPPELIAELKSTRPAPLIGYVSHVETEVIRQARESGCDTVMARSAFVQRLGEMMERFAA